MVLAQRTVVVPQAVFIDRVVYTRVDGPGPGGRERYISQFFFLPLRAVGVDAPSKLYSNFGTFAIHTDARGATSRFRTTELVWRLPNLSGSQRESTMKVGSTIVHRSRIAR